MKTLKALLLAGLLMLGFITTINAATIPPQMCLVQIQAYGTPPDGWSISCTNNTQHDFHWDGYSYLIHPGDMLLCDYGSSSNSYSGITITQVINDSCVCPPYATTYAQCSQHATTARATGTGTHLFWWKVQCGWCSGFCCGSSISPWVLVYNHAIGGDN